MSNEHSEMIIANCGSCPGVHVEGQTATCQVSRRPFSPGEHDKNAPPPKWCPLRRRAIMLRLEDS